MTNTLVQLTIALLEEGTIASFRLSRAPALGHPRLQIAVSSDRQLSGGDSKFSNITFLDSNVVRLSPQVIRSLKAITIVINKLVFTAFLRRDRLSSN